VQTTADCLYIKIPHSPTRHRATSPLCDDRSGRIATVVILSLPSIHTLLLTREVTHLNRRVAIPVDVTVEEDVEHSVTLAGEVVAGTTCTLHVGLVVGWTGYVS
jgi:hypothetical protein